MSECLAYQEWLVVLKLDFCHIDSFSLVFLLLQCEDVLGREGEGEGGVKKGGKGEGECKGRVKARRRVSERERGKGMVITALLLVCIK